MLRCNVDSNELLKFDYLNEFYECFKRDPRDGYSRGLQKLLEESKDVAELRAKLVPDSDKNGGAMRAVPYGVLANVKYAGAMAALQATVTHKTWGGANSAASVAIMSHFAHHTSDDFSKRFDYGIEVLQGFKHFKEPSQGPVKAKNDPQNIGVGMCTAHAVHTLLTTQTSLRSIMDQVIEWGGDTDSVAAIAWGIASARYSSEELPVLLERDLEPGNSYGVPYLKNLGQQLVSKFGNVKQ